MHSGMNKDDKDGERVAEYVEAIVCDGRHCSWHQAYNAMGTSRRRRRGSRMAGQQEECARTRLQVDVYS